MAIMKQQDFLTIIRMVIASMVLIARVTHRICIFILLYSNLFVPGTAEGVNVELEKAIRLEDFILMGELVANDALTRNESCGGHFREEYQTEEGEAKRDDENYFYVGCWEYQGSDDAAPVLSKEPLVYEAIKVQTRNYKN